MAHDREITCQYYTCEGGECKKRGISAHFTKECKTCKDYCPIKNGKPRRVNARRQKIETAIIKGRLKDI